MSHRTNMSGPWEFFLVVGATQSGSTQSRVLPDHSSPFGDRLSEETQARRIAAGELRLLGTFDSFSAAQAAADQGDYVARRRVQRGAHAEEERVIFEWEYGYQAVPAHAQQEGDLPLGTFDSFEAASRAAWLKARRTEIDQDQALRVIRYLARAGAYVPRGLVAALAKAVGATPGRVTDMDTRWEVSLERWVVLFEDDWFILKEHWNPRAGTCCSGVEAASADEAAKWRLAA